jgi:hypothetical protein
MLMLAPLMWARVSAEGSEDARRFGHGPRRVGSWASIRGARALCHGDDSDFRWADVGPHPDPLPLPAGLAGESEAVARPRSCAPERIPVAGLGPAIHVLRCGDCGCLKTWMPGTSPGKGLLEANSLQNAHTNCPSIFPGQPYSSRKRVSHSRWARRSLADWAGFAWSAQREARPSPAPRGIVE